MLWNEIGNKNCLMNVEYVNSGISYVTLVDPTTKEDVGKTLISEGLFLVEKRRDKKLQKLVSFCYSY
jgi:staphylococcal nuclease domain-containing protein 1